MFPGLSTIVRRRLAARDGLQHIFNFSRAAFLGSPIFAKFETLEGLHRRHGATVKLTCGLLVACLSVSANFGVGSGVWRKQICGVGADIGEVGLPLLGVGRTSDLLR